MARHIINGGIYLDTFAVKYGWTNQIKFVSGTPETFLDCILITPYTLEVELPDSFDPHVVEANALRDKSKDLDAKYAAAKAEIEARISSLLAITNDTKEIK